MAAVKTTPVDAMLTLTDLTPIHTMIEESVQTFYIGIYYCLFNL